ncbi:MAG: Triosephosphate isomerase [Candidatus Azambacteria bacterium GW2011_GWA2_39_10]|uniref:Triosephosphate isomerase n=1 Tax=Candidatus Azambacteria bacterium GW2011_GWA2_39_10 TaxID=1618611 RepID=A0A0G0PP87_9BACT|nr:MAG: Triosephosphate isomerase [Candidatus Azambacteria bacterium GW2011_GWA2_39_10]
MAKKYIIANWKMNPSSSEEALRLIKNTMTVQLPKNIELIIAPPFIYLYLVKKNFKNEIKLAAQNVGWFERGAFTGEISGLMLKNIGCDYVIIGHSERRHKIGETDEMINLKLKAAFKAGLNPILAVGEKERGDDIIKVINSQIKSDLDGIETSEISKLIIAYEPVWAIGTGLSDTPDHALSSALLIRKIIGNLYTPDFAIDLPVLYGGSVTAENAADFIGQTGINGALVGGASLNIEEFLKIIKSAG